MSLELITDILEDDGTSSSDSSRPTITIIKSLGQVRFSKLAEDLMNIKEGSFLEILIDRAENVIGFRVAEDKKDHVAQVFGQDASKGDRKLLKIHIRNFLDYFKIEEEKATIYYLKKNDEGIFVSNLSKDKKRVNKRNKKEKKAASE